MSSCEDHSDSVVVADGIPAVEEAGVGVVAKGLPVVAPFDTDSGSSATRLGLGEAFRKVRWKPIFATAAVFVVGFAAGFVAGPRSSKAPATGGDLSLDWIGSSHLENNLKTVVYSNSYCERRKAMARVAGLTAGLSSQEVDSPDYTAETAEVKMGSDAGLLAFIPAKLTICTGDSIKWINNRGGPHKVVFNEDEIPAGVEEAAISMNGGDQIGREGDTYIVKFTVAGSYGYYCEPHRGAGMWGNIVVEGSSVDGLG